MNYPTQQDKDDLLTRSELSSPVGLDAYLRGLNDGLALMRELNAPVPISSVPSGGSSLSPLGNTFAYSLCFSCGGVLTGNAKPQACPGCGHLNF